MPDTPTPAPSGGTDDPMPSPSQYSAWKEYAKDFDAWLERNPRTPPASAPGSGEVTAWGCEVDELVERIDRMTVEAGPGLDLRPHHQRMLIKEIWRLTEAVERARAEGEAKGRREALATALASAPDGPWIAFIGTKAPNGTCVRVFHKTQTHTFDLDSITTPKLHERPRGGAYDTELEGRSVCAILNLIANGDVK